MKYIVIGGGISGLSIARMLQDNNNEVTIYERESRPGGLIKCDVVEGNLFHRTGGHVFNTKRQDVFDWFWNHFSRNNEFTKTIRNASVSMSNGETIPYPIENHVYLLDEETKRSFIEDLVKIVKKGTLNPLNFEEFLYGRFGKTLYNLYFKPYNYKVWRKDLTKVPLSWLEGKLPMPTVQEMIYNNINRIEESAFVHSSFYYAKKGGSQFIVDRLAQGLRIKYNTNIEKITKGKNAWIVNDEKADRIIFCGNIKQLPSLVSKEVEISTYKKLIEELDFHGTTTVFCEVERNPFSWIYLPSPKYESHRIICTGNFAKSNNAPKKMTATIEFTDEISKDDIIENLKKMPFDPRFITCNFEKYTYPIQNINTREMVFALKKKLEKDNMYLLGRFAEWEYYNMDVAIGAALDLFKKIK